MLSEKPRRTKFERWHQQSRYAHRRCRYRIFVDHDVEVKVDDLDEVLRAAEVDPSAYHLHGSSDEGLCILPEGQAWKVFITERGSRSDERTFDTEDEACVYFLKRIFQLWRR